MRLCVEGAYSDKEGYMEKLFQVKIVLFVLVLTLSATKTSAQDHCSLVVKIVDSNDREVPEARITLVERNGRTVRAENRRGGVRFCDLGLLPVNITIGNAACNEVSVKNVPLEWARTKTIKVVYDDEPCRRDSPALPVCQILFRFSDEQNNWISGVTFRPPVAWAETPRSDQFGRAMVRIAAGAELRTSAEREGYVPEDIRLTCTGDLLFHEQLVKLRKK